MLVEEGLSKLIDARTLQQEIAEANDMTQEEINQAARELLKGAGSLKKSPFYEHLGGYSAQEMRDYNKFSSGEDGNQRQPRTPALSVDGSQRHIRTPSYSEDVERTSDDQMVYVTAL